MKNILLHPSTKLDTDLFIERPTHSLLLVGPNGIGKTELAKVIIAALIENQSKFQQKIISPVKSSISIDAVRELRDFIHLKTAGNKTIRRAIIIRHAETMTEEAQNALLKILEEPPDDTIIILTTQSERSLLPTIISRVAQLKVHAPSLEDVLSFFVNRGFDKSVIERQYALTRGLPAAITALLEEKTVYAYFQSIDDAKKILTLSPYERLLVLSDYASNKENSLTLIQALRRIAEASIDLAAQKNRPRQIQKWYHILKNSFNTEIALSKNGNTKLLLMKLFLSF